MENENIIKSLVEKKNYKQLNSMSKNIRFGYRLV
jgi:hypothetical protein